MPIVLGVPALMSGIATIFTGGYAVSQYLGPGKTLEEVKADGKAYIFGWMVQTAAARAGLELDPNDPMSDASFANAISRRTGVTIRTLKDQQKIREDLDVYAAGLISERSGYQVRSVSNVAILRADLMRIATAELTARLGLPVGVFPGDGEEWQPGAVRERLLAWAKAEITANLNEEIGLRVAELEMFDDVQALAGMLNERLQVAGEGQQVTARGIAMQIANSLANKAVADYAAVAESGTKRTRRQLQLREAQRKFRAAHGNRQVYVPLNMNATVG